MAAVFGIVTGAFGACSLAIELLEVINSIRHRWKRFHDIPSISREFSSSLQNIERLLMLVRTLATQESEGHYVFACLERCKLLLERVRKVTEEIEASTAAKKLWKIRGALRNLALEEFLSVTRVSLRETIDDLSLALLVLQYKTTCQNSLVLSKIEQSLSVLRPEEAVENSIIQRCRDGNGLTSLTDSEDVTQHERHLDSSCNCQVKAEAVNSQSSQSCINQTDLLRSDCSSNKHKHYGVYHIRSQQFDLWVGLLSVSILRKEKGKSDMKFRQRLSYTDIRLKFTPLSSFGKAFAARLYASTAAGLNVMHNLATVQIVPRYEGIFFDVCTGDVTSVRRRLYNKEASPDSTDKYGNSLITMAAFNRHVELIRLLLDLGANLQTADHNGRNPLHYLHHRLYYPLLQVDGEIYRLLLEKNQIDPWAPDFFGQNPWHIFCSSDQSSIDFPWQSMAVEYLPVINDQDQFGRTALFNMSSNVKANVDVFKWHLNNRASLSISANDRSPRWKGLTCLHAAIASLQPRYQCRFRPLDADIMDFFDYTATNLKRQAPYYDEVDRINQKSRIELLIQSGADLFAVADSYGTPTDLARFTGNYELWIDCLKACGISIKELLATDKKTERTNGFSVTKRLVHERRLEKQQLRQHFNAIFNALDDYVPSKDTDLMQSEEYITPTLPLNTNLYSQELRLFRKSLSRAVLVYKEDENPHTEQILVYREIFHGAYHADFFCGNIFYNSTIKDPGYKRLNRYIETLAAFISGEIDPGEFERKSSVKCLTFSKAIAWFHLDTAFRFPPLGCDWRYEDGFNEVRPDIPGSWPSD